MMVMSAFRAVVLAAGQGTRMKSARPKVLHTIAGLPLVSHVLEAVAAAGARDCAVIVPPEKAGFEAVAARAPITAQFFVPSERLGTAQAVLAARSFLEGASDPVLVLYGDTPLITSESIERLANALIDD